MSKPFLTARWTHLVLANYAVDPARLEPTLPPGCVSDRLDGSAFVSLVAFDFEETRVKGIRWPGLVNFPEINLRTYVRADGERGVTFIRELVPSRLIAWVARALYNEPYERAPMTSSVVSSAQTIEVEHRFQIRGSENRIAVSATNTARLLGEESAAHFFKEHELGVGVSRSGAPVRYRVEHPRWRTFPVESSSIEVDFAKVYGAEWAFLDDLDPSSVLLAEGSEVSVSPAR